MRSGDSRLESSFRGGHNEIRGGDQTIATAPLRLVRQAQDPLSDGHIGQDPLTLLAPPPIVCGSDISHPLSA